MLSRYYALLEGEKGWGRSGLEWEVAEKCVGMQNDQKEIPPPVRGSPFLPFSD